MESPIRVLHVVVNMNRGGAETLIMNLYRNIDRKKIQFDFLTCREGLFDEEIRQLGGIVHRIPYISEVGHFGYVRELNHFFAEHSEYKIVHSHMDKMSGLILKAAKKSGIPMRIAHSHSSRSEGGLVSRLYKSLIGAFIKSSATNLIACSTIASDWLYKNNSNQAKILKNGIDLSKFAFNEISRKVMRDELDVEEDTLVIGHVGRFFHPKNHDFIVKVFKELHLKRPNSILVLVGDGQLRKEIENKVIENGLVEKVRFLGVRSDVENVIQAFDVFVFPSLYEGLPVTLVEVQASGIPCLISDTITKEVDLGLGKIDYLPINETEPWINKLLDIQLYKDRKISTKVFIENGYDIEETAAELQTYYLQISR